MKSLPRESSGARKRLRQLWARFVRWEQGCDRDPERLTWRQRLEAEYDKIGRYYSGQR